MFKQKRENRKLIDEFGKFGSNLSKEQLANVSKIYEELAEKSLVMEGRRRKGRAISRAVDFLGSAGLAVSDKPSALRVKVEDRVPCLKTAYPHLETAARAAALSGDNGRARNLGTRAAAMAEEAASILNEYYPSLTKNAEKHAYNKAIAGHFERASLIMVIWSGTEYGRLAAEKRSALARDRQLHLDEATHALSGLKVTLEHNGLSLDEALSELDKLKRS